ncbi:unnamed protein product [Dicrocoelium dendriticum]|nr:unnamed protein product [Dicrocoelium dendriticum]
MFIHLSLVLGSLTTIAVAAVSQANVRPPVIIVPGFGGSRAYIRSKERTGEPFKQLWLDLKNIIDPSVLTKLFELTHLNNNHQSQENEKFEIIFPGWGDTRNLEYLDDSKHVLGRQFNTFVTSLVNTSFYRRNLSIRGAPYDFRKTPHENKMFMINLKKLIEQTYALNEMTRVALISHSMGTLYCAYFLHLQTQSWKKTYLQTFIAISGPFGGAARTTKAIASGDNFGVSHYPPLSVRRMLRSFSSLALLLPDERLWFSNETLIYTPNFNYSVHDMKRFFEDIKFARGYHMMRSAKDSFDYLKGPTGVDNVYCIHGAGIPTIERVVYKPHTLLSLPFPDQSPELVYGEGDGTVNLRSLSQCANWTGVHYTQIPKAHHTHILKDPRLLKLMKKILRIST